MDKLNRLWTAKERFVERNDRQAFEDYFTGALSALVDDKTWDKALDSARKYALGAGRKEREEPVNVEVIS